MRASEFVIEPGTKLLGKLADTGKIVQVIKQVQGPKFAKDPSEVWTLIDTEPGKQNKTSTSKWIPADTEFEWAREYLEKIDEGKYTKFADGVFKFTKHAFDRSKQRNIPMEKIVQALDKLNKLRSDDLKKLPPTGFVVKTPDFQMAIVKSQNIDTKKIEYALTTVGPKLKLAAGQRTVYLEDTEELDEGLRDWIAALAATGAMALGTPADAKQIPVAPTSVSQQAYDQISQALAKPAAQTLKKVAINSGITGTELAQFMAQCAHETANFTSLSEFGGSLDFRKYDPKYSPRKAKQLGNKVAGDGAKYKGRGYIQLTGRDNYKRAGQALGLPLEQQPELVERPDVAAKVAVWFWQNRVAPKVASFHDTHQVTKPINPAMRGLKDRNTKFNAIKQGAMATPRDMAPRGRKI